MVADACTENRLSLLEGPLKSGNRDPMKALEGMLEDGTPADEKGAAVFDRLKARVMTERPVIA